ncbi:MAG: asparagine synthase (glutamine-hydrolyzing) [Candidatus Pelagibacter sp.]|nr:asparagine synthase (glutamine-hydrolyzing) [Candidatus Pelagibacter sp.]OUV98138.1 MAG: asparagine synthase (glutamine-hydrolyzing) [Candidatus Pelagibacter sp. TMED142]
MCGISGFYGLKSINKNTINKTLKLMKNRGPEFSDYKVFINNQNIIYLLHSRLSIIDLNQRSNQPFILDNYVITFNGEIYNFKELKQKLIEKNVKFKTNSDTEVLLQYFKIYREKCFDFFEGMWALAIYDKKTNELILSRDRFSEKPLYYYQEGYNFYFGSEIKYIKELSNKQFTINKKKIINYLNLGYKSLFKDTDTFYKNIYSLNSGEYVILNNKSLIRKKYWKINTKINYKISQKEALNTIESLLSRAISLRTVSDVPITFCMGGGVDSAVLASYCVKKLNLKIRTYSIVDSDQRYNELPNIRRILDDLKCQNRIININRKDCLKNLKEIIKYHDSPLGTVTNYLHWLLMKEIKKDGYKVSISGTAADEIFSGYYEHFLLNFHSLKNIKKNLKNEVFYWKKNTFKNVRNKFFRNTHLYIDNPNFRDHVYDEYKKLSSYLNEPINMKFHEEKYCSNLNNNRRLNELFHETTPLILSNEDKNAMMNSVENRSPYLDKNLIEFMFSINPTYNIQNGITKYLLKETAKDYVDYKVLYESKKMGFNCSIDTLINFNSKSMKNFMLEKSPLDEFLNKKKISLLLNSNYKPNYQSKFLFNIVNTKLFLENNL